MNQKRKSIAKFLISTLVATFFLLCGANAQELLEGKFTLPSQVQWDRAVLDPGDYTFKIESMPIPSLITIKTADGSKTFVLVPISRNDLMGGGSFIHLTGQNGLHSVSLLNLPQLGFALVYSTASIRGKGSAEAKAKDIPVVVAQR